jgi:threonine synthase
MKKEHFPSHIQKHLIPESDGEMVYTCLGCNTEFGISRLLYVCPDCGSVLLLTDKKPERIKAVDGKTWR